MVFSAMKIICIGNRYINPDGAALWLFDRAIKRNWNSKITWIEGGLGGLNLLPHFDTHKKIIILDYMPSQTNARIIPLKNILSQKVMQYDHSTALNYLLQSLPFLLDKLPDIQLIACRPDDEHWQQPLFDTIQQLFDRYDKAA